jgi:hypothetical protein
MWMMSISSLLTVKGREPFVFIPAVEYSKEDRPSPSPVVTDRAAALSSFCLCGNLYILHGDDILKKKKKRF